MRRFSIHATAATRPWRLEGLVILHEKAETTDYPGLLSDVLDGLLSMTEENWEELCEELQEVVRPVVG